MLYRKSQSLNFWVALAVGSLAVGQITPATASPKPMQSGSGSTQSSQENQTYPTRINQNKPTNSNSTTTPPTGSNTDTRPTQSDGTNRTNPTDRRIYQNNGTMNESNPSEQNTPPAGANTDMRPTQSDGTSRTNPTDRRIYQNNNRTTKPNQSNMMNESNQASERMEGKVEQYLLNREGMVDGILLSNGVQVKFPPHMSSSLVSVIKPGDSVMFMGDAGTTSPFGQEVRASSITNSATERTIVDQPPTTPPTMSSAVNSSTMSVEGTAKHWLVGRGGEINGIILSNGTQVKFPPHVGSQLTSMAKVGSRIQAQGMGMKNSYGQVVEASMLTVDGKSIISNQPSGMMPTSVPPVLMIK